MGFWSRLFGREKTEPTAVVTAPLEVAPEVTPVPVAPTLTIAEVEAEVEELLRDLFPGALEESATPTAEELLAEKKRKRSEAAKKAAATRAANKAKK